jgi:hypothetical protein
MSRSQSVRDLVVRAVYMTLTDPLPCPALRQSVRDLVVVRTVYMTLTEPLPCSALSGCVTSSFELLT